MVWIQPLVCPLIVFMLFFEAVYLYFQPDELLTSYFKILTFCLGKQYALKENRKIWISMSICVSENAPHKSHYNYQAALIVSSFLWRNTFDARVLVSLIVERNENKSVLDSLVKTLEILGVDVIILEQEENVNCVLMAQTARILAYNYHEVID